MMTGWPAKHVPQKTGLRLEGLTVSYPVDRGLVTGTVVEDLSLTIAAAETLAIVGESGSGKSTVVRALLGLNSREATVAWRSLDVADATGGLRRIDDTRQLRGRTVGLVPQDPTGSFNPLIRIEANFAELHRHFLGIRDAKESRTRAVEALDAVGVDNAPLRLSQFPHELSGGLRQRILIALALVGNPQILLADEPTSNLDVTVQRRILDLFDELRDRRGLSVLLVTHDLAVAAERASRILVMRKGRIVEAGPTASIISCPQDSYTRQLLDAMPSRLPRDDRNATKDSPRVLEARNLCKSFGSARGTKIVALSDASLELHRGRTLAIVGQSGAGKSTLLRLLTGLERPDRGSVLLHGRYDPSTVSGRTVFRRHVQLVYQNPSNSLNPAYTIGQIITEPLEANRLGTHRERLARAADLLRQVELPESFLTRRPSQLSGGQLQRVAIARSLGLKPDVLVLDEPVSALDQAVQFALLKLLQTLQRQLGIAYLLVSHDLGVVRALADEVIVMRGGRIEEKGTTSAIFQTAASPYTRALLSAVPSFPSFSNIPPKTLGATNP